MDTAAGPDLPVVPAGEIDAQAVSGRAEPDGPAWGMQMVVRVGPQATHADAVTAAAIACVRLLASGDEDASVAQAVARWEDGRIRKVVRRAKDERSWQRALESDARAQVATVGATSVAAFPPGPVDAVPDGVRRLQVAGLDLPRGIAAQVTGEPVARVALTPYVPMSTGKACAQAAHAAHLAWMGMDARARGQWAQAGWPVLLADAGVEQWRDEVDQAQVQVRDAGFTEVPPGTRTAVVRVHGRRCEAPMTVPSGHGR